MSSVKENSGVIKLANGNTISIDDYVNKQEAKKVVRDLLLGTITSVKTLDNGRFYITPCWADEHGDDNICAFVSKNRKIEKDDIILGQVVLFSVGKDFQHEGKFIALDVQVYNKDSDIEFKTERPADYPTNVSKSRQTYIEKDNQHAAKMEAKKAAESDSCMTEVEIGHKLANALGFSNEEYDSLDVEETPRPDVKADNDMDDFMKELCGPKCSIYNKKGGDK